MIERGTNNTRALRQNFPEVYKNFFSKCEIVISSDDSFFWAGEYSRFFGGLAITQKMPLKAYVGLESTQEGDLGFGDTIGYNPATNQFNYIVLDEAKGQRLLNFLKSYLKSLPAGRKNGRGFIIHVLSEAPTGGGLGSTALF
jgi:mevalonate kinase